MSDQKAEHRDSDAIEHIDHLRQLSENADFRNLCRLRIRMSLLLTLAISLPYGLYILLTAWSAPLISQPLSDNGAVTWGMVLVFLVIVNGMLCAGIYTWWANKKFDPKRRDFLRRHSAGETSDDK